MSERWFAPEELEELSRPTMDRAIEAIDAGEPLALHARAQRARRLQVSLGSFPR